MAYCSHTGEWDEITLCPHPEECERDALPLIPDAEEDLNGHLKVNEALVVYYCNHNQDIRRSLKCQTNAINEPEWIRVSMPQHSV